MRPPQNFRRRVDTARERFIERVRIGGMTVGYCWWGPDRYVGSIGRGDDDRVVADHSAAGFRSALTQPARGVYVAAYTACLAPAPEYEFEVYPYEWSTGPGFRSVPVPVTRGWSVVKEIAGVDDAMDLTPSQVDAIIDHCRHRAHERTPSIDEFKCYARSDVRDAGKRVYGRWPPLPPIRRHWQEIKRRRHLLKFWMDWEDHHK